MLKVIELIIDEEEEYAGIEAISIVENPAIQEDFVALSEQEKLIELASQDDEKRILMGAALIPNKKIYRQRATEDGVEEYEIFFSEDTVRLASELFLANGNQNESTLEHQYKINGMSVVESWIVEDNLHDKSRKYGMNVPVGTWMVSVKVYNEDVWNNYVKTGEVKGFSIEGYFTEKLDKPKLELSEEEIELLEDFNLLLGEELELGETYNDYPQSATNNAKKVLAWKKKYGSEVKGMTSVGWTRASQLARRAKLSRSTIARMASFKRHQKNASVDPKFKSTPWKDRGYVAWLGWGGTSGVNWAINKLKSIDNAKKK